MSVDPGELTGRWRRSWPECPPIGHLLRRRLSDRWVRFHSLPAGKRYPTGTDEYREVLERHNAVLSAILGESGSATIYLVTVEYGPGDGAAGTEPIFVGLHPGAIPWMRVADPDNPGESYGLHISRQQFTAGDLDDLLRYVAEDRATGVIIFEDHLRWLFHPYDGGMDVIAPSAAERDRLTARFEHWRSDRPDGL